MKKELMLRREAIFNECPLNSVAVFFAGDLIPSSADAHYPFVINKNFFYLTNLEEDGLILLYQNTANGKKETLFIKDDNPLMEKWIGRSIKKEEAIDCSGVINIQKLSEFEAVLNRLFLTNDITSFYIDSERMSLKQPLTKADRFTSELKEAHPDLTITNLNKRINTYRRKKTKLEVDQMVHAMHVTHKGLNHVLKNLKPGKTEYQVAADFAYVVASENCTHAFDTIAASGEDACILHYVKNQKVLQDGDLILLDLGASYQNYASDITRTYPINGKFSERQKTFYNIVLKAQLAVIDAIQPGVSFQFLNQIVKETYKIECLKAKIIEKEEDVDQVYYHGVSHSLGLDTHDVGTLEGSKLVEGMVITVEPGLYSAIEGIGIRIEDDVLVTKDGCTVLSSFIEKTVEDIEKLMNSSK